MHFWEMHHGQHGGAAGRTLTSQQGGCGCWFWLSLQVVSVSVRVLFRYSGFLTLPRDAVCTLGWLATLNCLYVWGWVWMVICLSLCVYLFIYLYIHTYMKKILVIKMNKWSVAEWSNPHMLSMIHVTGVAPFKWEMNGLSMVQQETNFLKFNLYYLWIKNPGLGWWTHVLLPLHSGGSFTSFTSREIKTTNGHEHNISHTSLCAVLPVSFVGS